MQTQLSGGDSSTDILKKPDHILSFVKHALDPATAIQAVPPAAEKKRKQGLALEDLRIVDAEEDSLPNEEDSDDEDTSENRSPLKDEDMTSTAINLLLAILEGMWRGIISTMLLA